MCCPCNRFRSGDQLPMRKFKKPQYQATNPTKNSHDVSSRRHRAVQKINACLPQVGNSPCVERPVCPASRLSSQSNSPIVRDPIGRRLFIDVFFSFFAPRKRFSDSTTSSSSSSRFAVFDDRPPPHSLQPWCAHPLQRNIHICVTTFPFFTGFQIIFRPPLLRRHMLFFTCSCTPFFWAAHTWALSGAHPLVIRADNTESKTDAVPSV